MPLQGDVAGCKVVIDVKNNYAGSMFKNPLESWVHDTTEVSFKHWLDLVRSQVEEYQQSDKLKRVPATPAPSNEDLDDRESSEDQFFDSNDMWQGNNSGNGDIKNYMVSLTGELNSMKSIIEVNQTRLLGLETLEELVKNQQEEEFKSRDKQREWEVKVVELQSKLQSVKSSSNRNLWFNLMALLFFVVGWPIIARKLWKHLFKCTKVSMVGIIGGEMFAYKGHMHYNRYINGIRQTGNTLVSQLSGNQATCDPIYKIYQPFSVKSITKMNDFAILANGSVIYNMEMVQMNCDNHGFSINTPAGRLIIQLEQYPVEQGCPELNFGTSCDVQSTPSPTPTQSNPPTPTPSPTNIPSPTPTPTPDTPKPTTQPPPAHSNEVSVISKIVNTWISEGKTYHQYESVITALTQDLGDLTIATHNFTPISLWGLDHTEDMSQLKITDVPVLRKGESHRFGFITQFSDFQFSLYSYVPVSQIQQQH
eukprot:gene14554-17200_t